MGKLDIHSPAFAEHNKNYYRHIEDYDWVEVTDRVIGLESYFHRTRQKQFLEKLRPYLKNVPGPAILDAGCGTGLFSRHLPAEATAIDINPRHIAKAKKHAPHINFITGDLEQLPLPDNKYLVVVCTEVIEHFPDPAKPLKELKRVLRHHGFIIGTVPNESLIWRLRFLSSTRPHEPYHHYYSKKELVALLSPIFNIIDLKRISYGMGWFFAVKKF